MVDFDKSMEIRKGNRIGDLIIEPDSEFLKSF